MATNTGWSLIQKEKPKSPKIPVLTLAETFKKNNLYVPLNKPFTFYPLLWHVAQAPPAPHQGLSALEHTTRLWPTCRTVAQMCLLPLVGMSKGDVFYQTNDVAGTEIDTLPNTGHSLPGLRSQGATICL